MQMARCRWQDADGKMQMARCKFSQNLYYNVVIHAFSNKLILVFILVLSPASSTFLLQCNFLSESWHIGCLVLVCCFLVWAEKWLFFGGRFLATDFGKKG